MSWLKELREKNNLTQKELAKATNLNIYTIQNIEQGKRWGNSDTIKALMNFFNIGNISYDCEDLIEELKEDIAEFGPDEELVAFFEKKGDYIFLTNYDFNETDAPFTKEELKDYVYIVKISAKEILKILEYQNSIIK